LLDAWEETLDARYLSSAEKTMRLAVGKFGDAKGGGFFDRAADAAPLPGLNIRRKPIQDSPSPSGNSVACIVLERLYAGTGDGAWQREGRRCLEAFGGIGPQLGLFAGTYGLAMLSGERHAIQVLITGRPGDPQAMALERAAAEIYRFGKSVLRAVPGRSGAHALPPSLRDALAHVDREAAQAFICRGSTCQAPVSNPEELRAALTGAR
jgi:uncharacterized protein